jgi:hypothetical protein
LILANLKNLRNFSERNHDLLFGRHDPSSVPAFLLRFAAQKELHLSRVAVPDPQQFFGIESIFSTFDKNFPT